MKQQKPEGGKPAPAPKAAGASPQRPKRDNAERYTVKPEFWDSIFDSLPPWGDEIVAIVLIMFGIFSFLSLLNVSTDATIANAWSSALTSLFGYGSVIVAVGILGLGIIMLLPKLGLTIRFPTLRVLALEIAFLSLLALLHLGSGDNELRAMARAGRGGGQVGWALSLPAASLVSTNGAILFYGLLLLASLAVVAGARPRHIRALLQRGRKHLLTLADQLASRAAKSRELLQRPPDPPPDPLGDAIRGELPKPPARTPVLMRIRPDPASLPPSLRPGVTPPAADLPPDEDDDHARPAIPAPESAPPGRENRPDSANHPLFNRRETTHLMAIGTIKGRKTKNGVVMVERPDGRVKRYFTVDSMKEPKYTGKRPPELPPLDLLQDVELNLPDEQEINNNVVLIENTLLEFDIDVDVVDVKCGPTVTQYAIQPFRETTGQGGETVTNRTRVNKIVSLASDLALALSARRLRLESPVPGHTYIGVEVPNRNPSVVALRSVYESRAFFDEMQKRNSPLVIPLGRDVAGKPVMVDLASMPHMLIAGTTGSGKSVCIAAIASALVLNNLPDTVKLIMLDPKMVELSRFNGLPHLLGPVETDQERIIGVLRWCTREMDRRYKLLEEYAARNIDAFNAQLGKRRKDEYMPYIVILIDEIGDLMLSRPDETEKTITRLAQKARAAGMHLIVATQRPSVDVITGLIKANFPARISFAVASGIDSRVILDAVGAETLMGRGDMLYQAPDAAGPRRLQGCYVSDDEVRAIVNHWRTLHEKQIRDGLSQDIGIGPWERGLTRREFLSETDPMLEQAITLVIAEGEASASLIQRRLGVGYPRAARIMDLLEELGVVGEVKSGGRTREVLIKPGKDPFKDIIEKRMKGQG